MDKKKPNDIDLNQVDIKPTPVNTEKLQELIKVAPDLNSDNLKDQIQKIKNEDKPADKGPGAGPK